MLKMKNNHKNKNISGFSKGTYEIHLENSSAVKKKGMISSIILRILIAFSGTLSVLSALNSSYNLKVNMLLVSVFILIFLMGLTVTATISKQGIKCTLLVFSALIAIIIQKAPDLIDGGKYVLNNIITPLNDYYSLKIQYFPVDLTAPVQESVNLLFIFAGILISTVMITISYQKVRGIPLFIIGESGIILLLASGLTLNATAVFAGLFYAVLIAICSNGILPDKNITEFLHGQAVIIYMCAITAITVSLLSVYPVKEYKKIAYLEQVKQEMNHYIETFDWENTAFSIQNLFTRNGKDGMSDSENLSRMGTLDEIELTDNVDLSVQIKGIETKEQLSSLYLRGFVGSIYKDNTWRESDPEIDNRLKKALKGTSYDPADILTLPGQFLYDSKKNFPTTDYISMYTIDIKTNGKKRFTYVPYYAYLLPTKNISDDKSFNMDKDSYHFVCYNAGTQGTEDNLPDNLLSFSRSLSDDSFKECEGIYRQYVRDTYLQIPDEKEMPDFHKNFSTVTTEFYRKAYYLSHSPYKTESIEPYIDYVRTYLSRFPYTLKPGKTDSDKDFVEDFLFHKKEGYCTYFASAATLIFRKLGIPARYAEGYRIPKEELEAVYHDKNGCTANITNKHAHAWVEIYSYNFGWIPIEVTSGYDEDESATDITEAETTGNTEKETESTTPAETETTSETESETESMENGMNTLNANGHGTGHSFIKKMPGGFLTLFLVLILPGIIYLLLIKRRNSIREKRLAFLDSDTLMNQISQILYSMGLEIKNGMQTDEIVRMAGSKLKEFPVNELQYLFRCMDKERFSKECALDGDEIEHCLIILDKLGNEALRTCGFFMGCKIYYVWGLGSKN